ncbi:MAG: hypothetical protein JW748_11360 [Anaerolineales bacterium]|nr:hypothetical protein [Anaerolineales bacterium]
MNIIWKNGLIMFGIVFLFSSILGNLLYMNPLVAGIYERMAGHPGIKPWQEFGTIANFVLLNIAAGVFLNILYVILFSIMRGQLPNSWLAAGLIFGMLVILVKAAPEGWNQYLNINYPAELILAQLINSSIGIIATGIVLSLAWTRWPVIR